MTIKQQFEAAKDNKEQLDKFYKKYAIIFNMKAKILCEEIVKVFKENEKFLKVNPVHEVVGDYYEMQQHKDENSYYQETISTSIVIKDKTKIEKVVLIENSTAESEKDFQLGIYNVNIFNLLLNNNLPYANLIHKGCWRAIKENIKEQTILKNL